MKYTKVDRWYERSSRTLAGQTSRRGVLARLGALVLAVPAFPLLPLARGADRPEQGPAAAGTDFSRAAQAERDTECNYWRYCGTDGSLCSCCGGGVHSCPPGSQASPTAWIGSCINPEDQRAYLIAYRDCCGVGYCGKCYCNNTERETPVYRPTGNNNIIWCFGTSSMEYHCSMAVMVGLAES